MKKVRKKKQEPTRTHTLQRPASGRALNTIKTYLLFTNYHVACPAHRPYLAWKTTPKKASTVAAPKTLSNAALQNAIATHPYHRTISRPSVNYECLPGVLLALPGRNTPRHEPFRHPVSTAQGSPKRLIIIGCSILHYTTSTSRHTTSARPPPPDIISAGQQQAV